ncbi:MAG TPA: MMPL family transporter [Acidimicrobiia bacterium]|nr:MMPL family transporter [Acidimicrobiia bacterium]
MLVLWLIALVGVIAAGRSLGGDTTTSFSLPNVESQQAFQLLQTRFPSRAGDSAQIVFATPSGVRSAAARVRVAQVLGQLVHVPHVTGVVSPYAVQGRRISTDGTIGFATVQFDQRARDLPKSVGQAVVDRAQAANGRGVQVEAGGSVVQAVVRPQPPSSELFGLLAAILILLIAFGSVIAMGLPILTALFGLGVGLGSLPLFALVFDMPTFAAQLAAMIGLGVGIDYALFIVTRYRQELHAGRDPEDAVRVSLTTSGRAVVFAGCTVIISLLGMLLMGLSFVQGLAVGAVTAVLLVMLASVTLLPSVLGFTGRAIDRFHVPGLHRDESAHRATLAYRWSRQVQSHPWRFALGGLAALLLLCVPVLSLRLGNSDAGNDPTSLTSRRSYDLLSKGFGPGFNGPLVVAARLPGPGGRAVVQTLRVQLEHTAGVASVTPAQINPRGDAAVITVYPVHAPQDVRTTDLVHRLRDTVVPRVTAGTGVVVKVGGNTASGVDLSDFLGRRLPYFIGAVILLSFLLLMVVFRSLVVPLKAAVMNLLSIGAAYGIVVAVFQWGWLGSIIGINKSGPIDAFVPMMLFAVLFGLSMDYEVFLLSRVREEYGRSRDNAVAVADGLAATARVITAAAAIMISVFLAFVLGDTRVIKLFGLGLASAIFIDATLVRMLLVPATMELLGDANWWLPRWLDRLLPDVDVEGTHTGEPSPPEPEPEPVAVGSR